MTKLDRAALARLTFTADDIAGIWSDACIGAYAAKQIVLDLCASHERLRMELAGATAMLAALERKAAHGCAGFKCGECDR